MLIASDEPDIMMLTELIPKAQINPTLEIQISIKGYEIFTNFNYTDTNLGSSGIRGVAIYVKENLICREIKFRGIFEDHVWVEISLKNKDALLCGCIYRSPTDDKLSTIESTAKVCKFINESVKRMNSHLIICGDFNYPRIDWESEFVDEKSSVITPFIDTIQSCYLYQHIFQPARFREGNEPGLLDLIFSNEEGMVFNLTHKAGLGDSDHICIYFVLNCYHEDKNTGQVRNCFESDYATIRERLSHVNWTSELRGDFSTTFVKCSQILAVSMDGCSSEYHRQRKTKNLYLTPEAIRKKNLKNKLWRHYIRTRSNYDRTRFNTAKNELRSLTRNLRLKFESTIAENIKTSPKSFWSYVKSKTKTRCKIPPLKKTDGTEAVTALEKAQILNTFFSSTFTEERLEDLPINTENPFLGEYLDSFVITPEMVDKKLQELNQGKSPGPDGWHPVYLKNVSDLIAAL